MLLGMSHLSRVREMMLQMSANFEQNILFAYFVKLIKFKTVAAQRFLHS